TEPRKSLLQLRKLLHLDNFEYQREDCSRSCGVDDERFAKCRLTSTTVLASFHVPAVSLAYSGGDLLFFCFRTEQLGVGATRIDRKIPIHSVPLRYCRSRLQWRWL